MPLYLNFDDTNTFRTNLLKRNLKDSYGSSMTLPVNFTSTNYTAQGTNDFSVIDQPDVIQSASGLLQSLGLSNRYAPDQYEPVNLQVLNLGLGFLQSYIDSFTAQDTSLISILTNSDEPTNESQLAIIARKELRNMVYETMGIKLDAATLGRVNLLEGLQDPDVLGGLLTGREKLIERDYQITVPGSGVTKAAEYFARITGGELPVSYIPGNFFEDNINKGKSEKFLDKAKELTGQALNLDFTSGSKTYNQKLLQYTSGGQKSKLFSSIDYNKYRPDYEESKGVVGRTIDTIENLLGFDSSQGSYYIGNSTVEPISMFSQNTSTVGDKAFMVFGPSKMVKLFEGEIPYNTFNENTRTYRPSTKSTNVETSFVWTSGEDYRGEFKTAGNFSNEKTINPDSILAKTQEIVDDKDSVKGIERLQHPGHIISNTSYKYHDGYKEISKGNAVRGEDGEYCRVWTKDYAYDRSNRMVRYKGIQDTQRRIPGSVIRSQRMLNIAPTRDSDGKPINFGDAAATKYMLSIENLAWQGSDKLKDRPLCEQGPNGGRIMWFPPYDLKYTDDNRASWTTHTFLGRPEPIYTYNNAERTGTLSFKVVVDHPSIFNLIRKKAEKDYSEIEKIEILESFIAGCKDMDIYDLANEFTSLSISEINTLEQYISTTPKSGETKKELLDPVITKTPQQFESKRLIPYFEEVYGRKTNLRLYWYNDIPGPHNKTDIIADTDYMSDLQSYLGDYFISGVYQDKANKLSGATEENVAWGTNEIDDFEDTLSGIRQELLLLKDAIDKTLSDPEDINKNYKFRVTIEATTSAKATQVYNDALAKRRGSSLIKYLFDDVDPGRYELVIKTVGENTNYEGIDCSKIQSSDINGVDARIYSKSATYCRSAKTKIELVGDVLEAEIISGTEDVKYEYDIIRDEIETDDGFDPFDLILKTMHSECDYFYELQESDPLVFDTMVDKLKYFQPAFHSTTPEGLNKRLTFLQQCLRPGETIKVYDEKGDTIDNISSNTSFGKPPICVLRIGDFYHTKIAIDNVNISYDDTLFDMNPEGIGMQPMIASVQLGIKMIGGHGISEVIEELQNALSFNYYANTEVYEPMSTRTEGGRDQKKVDELTQPIRDKLTKIYAEQLNNPEISKDNDAFWGNILEGNQDYLTYNQFYNKFVSQTNDYVNTVISEVTTLTEKYGEAAINDLFFSEDKFFKETTIRYSTTDSVKIPFIGNTREDYNLYFNQLMGDVNSRVFDEDFSNNLIYQEMSKTIAFNSDKIEEFKTLMFILNDEVVKYHSGVGSDIGQSLLNIYNKQMDLQRTIDAIDIIFGDEIDGRKVDGEYEVYMLNNISTANGDLSTEVEKVLNRLSEFMYEITNKVRSNTVLSTTGYYLSNVGTSDNDKYYYNETIPSFYKQNYFPIEQFYVNNDNIEARKSLKKAFVKALEKIANDKKENFKIGDYRWDSVKDTELIFEFLKSQTTNPTNIQKITYYYEGTVVSENDESDYAWKQEIINQVSPILDILNA